MGESLLRETLEDELQKLQLTIIDLKSKNKVAKKELEKYKTRLNELECENKLLAFKESKCQSDLKAERDKNDLLQTQFIDRQWRRTATVTIT